MTLVLTDNITIRIENNELSFYFILFYFIFIFSYFFIRIQDKEDKV